MNNKIYLNVDETFKLALQSHQKNNLQVAQELYNEVLNKNSEHTSALNNLGLISQQFEEHDKAISYYEKAIKFEPNHIEAHFNLALVLQILKKQHKAISYYEKIIKIDPTYINAFNNLANIHVELGENDKALKYYEKVLEINSNFVTGYINYGKILFKLKYYEKAIYCYKKLIKIAPDNVTAYNNLAIALDKMGEHLEATKYYEKVVNVDPNNIKSLNDLANIYSKLNEIQKAISYYEKAIAIDPNHASIHSNLGSLYNKLGDNENSLNCFKKVIELDPKNFTVHYHLGVVFYNIKQFKDAAECFKSTDYKNSKSYLLSCLYHLDEKNNFFKEFDNLINKSAINPLIGSLSLRSEIKYGIKKENLFCKNPLKHVLTTNLNEQCDFKNIFTEGVKNILSDKLIIPREQDLITKGQQTAGNIFDLENDFTNKIKDIVLLEIEKYKVYFKDSEEGFLKNWPTQSNLFGWLVSMKNGGNLAPHMHELGWLSGSIYINVPPKLKTDSGNLVLTIDDNDFKNDENSKKNIDVVTGTICLFPSSLHHYTIPFESNEDRIVLAFDVMPG